jgi:hypothetical protein
MSRTMSINIKYPNEKHNEIGKAYSQYWLPPPQKIEDLKSLH